MTISDKLKIIHDNGLKTYPVERNRRWAIHVEDKYKLIFPKGFSTGEYKHTTSNQINEAQESTLDWLIEKIKNIYLKQ